MTIEPHHEKYHQLYWDIAWAASKQSYAIKRKVGAVLVLPTGMLSIGWNGTPTGFPNQCEYPVETDGEKLTTLPEVIHAERNAIDKMTRQGISTQGSILFVTYAPCFECAKAIQGLGIKTVYYATSSYKLAGIEFLNTCGIVCRGPIPT